MLVFLKKKLFFLIWAWPMMTPFLPKLGRREKEQFLEVLAIFFRTTGFKLKILILIEFPNILHGNQQKNQIGCGLGAKFTNYVQCCEKIKKQVISLGFFIFYLGLPFKARSSGCKTT